MLTVAATADRLNVSADTVYALIAAKKLPASRIGRLWRVSEADMAAYLERTRTVKPAKVRPKPDLSNIPEYV